MRKLIYVIAFIAFIALTGCPSHDYPPPAVPAASDNVTKADVYAVHARDAVVAAKPHADPTGQVHLSIADTDLVKAHAELQEASQNVGKLNKVVQDQRDTIVSQGVTIKAYKTRWVGDRTWLSLKIIVGVWLAAGLAAVVITYLAPTGIFGMLAQGLLHLIPIANPFVWLGKSVPVLVNVLRGIKNGARRIKNGAKS